MIFCKSKTFKVNKHINVTSVKSLAICTVDSSNINAAIKTNGSQPVGSKILPNLLQCFEWENDYIKPNMQTQKL